MEIRYRYTPPDDAQLRKPPGALAGLLPKFEVPPLPAVPAVAKCFTLDG
ncbi:hypothetical protein [Pseudorhodoferax sp.]|nr:hypothetical protein [Pseudorhodoferax sp.]